MNKILFIKNQNKNRIEKTDQIQIIKIKLIKYLIKSIKTKKKYVFSFVFELNFNRLVEFIIFIL